MIVEQRDPDGTALLHHDGIAAREPESKEERYAYWLSRVAMIETVLRGMKHCKERQQMGLELDRARLQRNRNKPR